MDTGIIDQTIRTTIQHVSFQIVNECLVPVPVRTGRLTADKNCLSVLRLTVSTVWIWVILQHRSTEATMAIATRDYGEESAAAAAAAALRYRYRTGTIDEQKYRAMFLSTLHGTTAASSQARFFRTSENDREKQERKTIFYL